MRSTEDRTDRSPEDEPDRTTRGPDGKPSGQATGAAAGYGSGSDRVSSGGSGEGQETTGSDTQTRWLRQAPGEGVQGPPESHGGPSEGGDAGPSGVPGKR
jgi:hypothetical protein